MSRTTLTGFEFAMWTRLALNSQKLACLCLLHVGIKSMNQYAGYVEVLSCFGRDFLCCAAIPLFWGMGMTTQYHWILGWYNMCLYHLRLTTKSLP